MRLKWVDKGFISKDLYAPFVLDDDYGYRVDLEHRFSRLYEQARGADADPESLEIIDCYKAGILRAIDSYYRADLTECNKIVEDLVGDIGDNPLAVAPLRDSWAFPGDHCKELQLFRCRTGGVASEYGPKDFLHLPRRLRSKTGGYRFSTPGAPCLYLANSSYCCWVETGFPDDANFNVAPVLLDGGQRIFNLAVSIKDFSRLNEFEGDRVHCWLKLLMLAIATSYRVKETDRSFRSEYVISQSLMMACRRRGYDGVAYYSKRVSSTDFAYCAVNLALFVDYYDHSGNGHDKEYSPLVDHMKIGTPFNFSMYRKLLPSLNYQDYELRSVRNGVVTNIGTYGSNFPYRETEFFEFDKFLFSRWEPSDKDSQSWGIPAE